MDSREISLKNPVIHTIRVFIIYKGLFKLVETVEDLPVGRDLVVTDHKGIDGSEEAFHITVEVGTRVSGFVVSGCINTCVIFRDINV